ncbi:hypothetical protein ACJX0J_009439, partial [Zea mays]
KLIKVYNYLNFKIYWYRFLPYTNYHYNIQCYYNFILNYLPDGPHMRPDVLQIH